MESNLATSNDLDRRAFLMTKLAAGFALAVQPVSAEAITTDTNGLICAAVTA
jgi:carboxymethylenebutenolidase